MTKAEVEHNNRVLNMLKTKSREELEELKQIENLSFADSLSISLALQERDLEDGIGMCTHEDVFREIYGEIAIEKIKISSRSKKRLEVH